MVARRVAVILFEGFELLDVFGPVELFGVVPEHFRVSMVGPTLDAVSSSQGTRVLPDESYAAAETADVVMVPGGRGTRILVDDAEFLAWLAAFARDADIVSSVCTGSALLAAAGLLEGYSATSNKLAFGWASGHGRDVRWQPRARWVEDRTRWTSSGVAAGMDMTAALIAALASPAIARQATDRIELETHPDPHRDPFAEIHGTVHLT